MQEKFDQSYNLQTLSVRDVSSACLCWMNTQSSTPAYFPSVRVKKERKKALRLLESHKKWLIKKIHNIDLHRDVNIKIKLVENLLT